MINDALVEIQRIAEDRGLSRDYLRGVCFGLWGVEKFSELGVSHQWGLVYRLDPECVGPYGEVMKEFDTINREGLDAWLEHG